jgi:hypothetical protein
MFDWVVIVTEYQPRHIPWLHPDDQPTPDNTHYTPLVMSEYIPLTFVAFVAETRYLDIPVFDVAHAADALQAYRAALPGPFAHSWLRIPDGPYDFKPFRWLQDQFGVYGMQNPHRYIDIYRTRPLNTG